jgi:hypothetical protein
MMMAWNEVAQRALDELTHEERRGGVAYLDQAEHATASVLRVNGREISIRPSTAVVFVDRVPQANWGHSCRYLLIDREDGRVESIDAQFPPFMRGVPKTLRVLWKGEAVPDWGVTKP